MYISEATEHLANLASAHYKKIDPEDSAVIFLDQVSRIKQFCEKGNLGAWDEAVIDVFNESEWEQFENRNDFNIIEFIWEVGRCNIYGAINETETKKLYHHASKAVYKLTGILPANADLIDFTKW